MRAAGALRELGLLLVAVIGVLACFTGKAFSIDDPMYLWLGAQLQAHPLDPFGFMVNWNASQLPMHEINQNPPLTGYYIALAASLVGWSERALHAAFLLPAAAAATATWALARRLCRHPLEASLVALLTPAVLVSATNVNCEALLLACWCGSVLCWVIGFDRERPGWLFAAGLLAALALLTKFSGLALVPLLAAYGLLRTRRVGAWCLHLLVPILAGVAYDRATASLYGVGHIVETLRFAGEFRVADQGIRVRQAVLGLVFAGGCLIPALCYAPLLWSRRACLGAVVAVALAALAWPGLGPLLGIALADAAQGKGGQLGLVLQLLLFGAAGASLVPLALGDLRRRRDADSALRVDANSALRVDADSALRLDADSALRVDADSALLVLWLLGTLVFASFLNWVTNGRSIVPMAPAFGILLVRRLEDRRGEPGAARAAGRFVALAAGAAVAVWVTSADYRWANTVRDDAVELARRHVGEGHDTYFLGNWGLQYYLGLAGAIAVDDLRWPRRGDRLVVSSNNTDMRQPPEALARRLEVIEGGRLPALRTVARGVAGFYASTIGPLPFAVFSGEPDRYTVFELSGPVRFSPSW
jgi:4-amino-4-deoxy-L-arabinose transferase-like glycosyltransferase